jgi:hypothetical protein
VAMWYYTIANNTVEGNIALGGEKIPHFHTTVTGNSVRPGANATTASIVVLSGTNAGETTRNRT